MQNLSKKQGRIFKEPKIKDLFFYWFLLVIIISIFIVGHFNKNYESVIPNSGGNYELENVVSVVLSVFLFGVLPAFIRSLKEKNNSHFPENLKELGVSPEKAKEISAKSARKREKDARAADKQLEVVRKVREKAAAEAKKQKDIDSKVPKCHWCKQTLKALIYPLGGYTRCDICGYFGCRMHVKCYDWAWRGNVEAPELRCDDHWPRYLNGQRKPQRFGGEWFDATYKNR